MRFDHVGVVVKTAEIGRRFLADAFLIRRWTAVFTDPVNDVVVQFGLDPAGVCYETIAPISDRSPVRRALAGRVNIVNHVAYVVDDLAAHRERLAASGFIPTGEPKPAVAYGGQPIQFFFNRHGMLFELIEAPGHRHAYVESDG